MRPNAWHGLRARHFRDRRRRPVNVALHPQPRTRRSGRTKGISLRHGVPSSRDVRTRRCVPDAAVADVTTLAGIPDVWRWRHASPAGLRRGRRRGERTRIATTGPTSNLRAGGPAHLYLPSAAEIARRRGEKRSPSVALSLRSLARDWVRGRISPKSTHYQKPVELMEGDSVAAPGAPGFEVLQ